jgi:uncharacterized protein YyaL (SSP411 family)
MAAVFAAVLSLAAACSAAEPANPKAAPKSANPKPASGVQAAERPANRLAKESSPYLLLHAHNPVDWYPWGEEALAKAKREKKLIFLSVGYSSCYWCHVMERESFLDDQIAAELNEHFVAVKVDREERPDIDEVYMRSLQIYSQLVGAPQGGGWPLTMFLSPDAKPLVGGTYFPPRDREGRTGLLGVLKLVHERWSADPTQWQKSADQIAGYVRESLASRPAVIPVKLEPALVDAVQQALAEQYDPQYGGFGYSAENPRRPKFPEPPNLAFLLDRATRGKNADAREMLFGTLDKMAAGGIRDHLGGGFHRYSTDRFWRVPHFEKMLYDNAQLVAVYARAYELDARDEYRQIVVEALGFVRRELTDPQGGFYCAVDAETAGQEGVYYAWTPSEIKDVLTADEFALATLAFGLDDKPNFEERYVLTRATPLDELAKARKQDTAELQIQLRAVEDKLLAAREKRPRPATDTKVLAGWNGLMIAGYAEAGRVWKNPQYLAAAAKAADFLLANLRTADGRLLRSYRQGQGKVPAFLDDYAFSIAGLLALYRADGNRRWLDAAADLQRDQLARFWDERGGGFYFTSADHEVLFARSKMAVDGVMPSGSSVSAANLIELGRALPKPEHVDRARETIAAVAPLLKDSPSAAPQMAVALAELLDESAAPKGP